MKIKDLIKHKDYDYISYRIILDDEEEFIGCCKSKNGKLFPLDGDTIYDEEDEIIRYIEWDNPETGVTAGLTVVVDEL